MMPSFILVNKGQQKIPIRDVARILEKGGARARKKKKIGSHAQLLNHVGLAGYSMLIHQMWARSLGSFPT